MGEWDNYLKKTARVFGERSPMGLDETALPYEDRLAMFKDYSKRKAREERTPLSTALLTGGGLGLGLGGLLGAAGGKGGAIAGAGVGALMGGGLGALLSSADASEIAQMKTLQGDPKAQRRILNERIVSQRLAEESAKRWDEQRRHRETINAIHGINKRAAGYDEAFRPLLAYLRALYQLHQFIHWQTRGATFYGDHQLFQRLYEKIAEELDALAEKAIGVSGNPDVVDPKADADGTATILKNFEVSPAGALNAEKGFISLISATKEGLGDLLTDGLDNLLQGIADTHEGHVYLLQQRVDTGGIKQAAQMALVRNKLDGRVIAVPMDKVQSTFLQHQPGAVELYAPTAGAVAGAGLGTFAANALARRAGMGGLARAATATLGGVGGASTGLLGGAAAGNSARTGRLNREWSDLEKHKVQPKAAKPAPLAQKQASLDRALGSLYVQYGPPLQKHAAVTFFNYSLDKDQLDEAALGKPFCKFARASYVDPWVLARRVVSSYPTFVKHASSHGHQQVREISQFYVNWADAIIKHAAAPGAGAVKRVVDAGKNMLGVGRKTMEMPSQVATLENKAHGLRATAKATKRDIIAARTAAGKPMPVSSPVQTPTMTKAQRQQAAAAEYARRGMAAPTRQGGGVAGAPRPAATAGQAPGTTPPKTRPASGAAQGTTPQAGQQSTPQQSQIGNYVRGGLVLGGLGLGGAAMMGGDGQQPAYGGY